MNKRIILFLTAGVLLFAFNNCTGGKFSIETTLSHGTSLSSSVPNPTPTGCPNALPNVNCAGDGITDDTTCLQAAISKNTQIVLPSGKSYLVTSTLEVPAGKTILGNSSQIISKSASATTILSMNGSSVMVCGVQFNKSGSSQDAPIVNISAGIQNVNFTNNSVTGAAAMSVYIAPGGPTNQVAIQNNIFSSAGFGVLLNAASQGPSLSNYQHDITIDSNIFTNSSSDAIEINSPVYNMPEGSQTPGIAVYNIKITNNTISNSGEFGVGFAGGLNSTITGNQISNTGTPAGAINVQGIHLEDYASNVTVVSNSITATSTGQYHDAIFVSQSNKIFVFANIIDHTGDIGIVFYNNPNGGSFISGNTISNSPSDGMYIGASPNLMAGPSNGYGGNITKNSGSPGNQGGQGSIELDSMSGDVVTENSGN